MRKERGAATPLDDFPVLTAIQTELWQMFQFTGDSIMVSLDIYAKRIGLPKDWSFQESAYLLSFLQSEKMAIQKAKREAKQV